MEFARIRDMKLEGKAPAWAAAGRTPSFSEAKEMEPVVVDDLLDLAPLQENLERARAYAAQGVGLVPIRRRPARRQEADPSFPGRILLELTSRCNLRCVMCPRNQLKRPELDMPRDTALRLIDEIDAHGAEGLWLYNIGESMLHPEFADILEHCARKKNLGSIWLSTNGQELKEDLLGRLMDSPITFLNFSLNALSAESYKLISPNGDYAALLSNLHRLVEAKRSAGRSGRPPWLRIQMVDQPQVSSEIDRFLQEYGDAGDILSVNILEAFSQNVPLNVRPALARERGQKRCKRIDRGDAFIFSDGEVSFCDTDFNHEMSIGSVHKDSLRGIWGGAGRRGYQDLNDNGRLDEVPMCCRCLDYDL